MLIPRGCSSPLFKIEKTINPVAKKGEKPGNWGHTNLTYPSVFISHQLWATRSTFLDLQCSRSRDHKSAHHCGGAAVRIK